MGTNPRSRSARRRARTSRSVVLALSTFSMPMVFSALPTATSSSVAMCACDVRESVRPTRTGCASPPPPPPPPYAMPAAASAAAPDSAISSRAAGDSAGAVPSAQPSLLTSTTSRPSCSDCTRRRAMPLPVDVRPRASTAPVSPFTSDTIAAPSGFALRALPLLPPAVESIPPTSTTTSTAGGGCSATAHSSASEHSSCRK